VSLSHATPSLCISLATDQMSLINVEAGDL
jgi:hypothetical protein